MKSTVEDRLHEALTSAGATITPETLRPLAAPERRRLRVDVRFAVTAVAVVLVGAATAGVLSARGGQPGDVQTASMSVFDQAALSHPLADVSVFLCTKQSLSPSCQNRPHGATDRDMQAIQQVLKGLPGIQQILFEDQAFAYKNFRQSTGADDDLLKAIRVEDMPNSFRVTVLPEASTAPVIAGVRDLPGVAAVRDARCLLERARPLETIKRAILGDQGAPCD